jgi:hypothetical protein
MRQHLASISPQVPQFDPCSVVLMILCASLMAGIASVGPAIAQTTTPGLHPFDRMGVTSPLAAQSTQSAVIPLGSTEIATPGISPLVSEQSALTTACAAPYGAGSSAAPFDGGANSSATSLSCADSRNTSSPLRSPLSIGRAEVPLGATEIAGAGISPAEPVAGPHFPSSVRPANSPPTIADPHDR